MNAEFNQAFDSLKGSEEELVKVLPNVCEAVIDCYRGDCQLCEEHSYVCNKEKPWSRPYLDVNPVYRKCRTFINANADDLNKLRTAIGVRFSSAAIKKTLTNSTQNKCEASNRGLKKATPNSLTFKRNYHGRIHSAVHSMNNHPGTSTRKLCEASGSKITNSKVLYESQKMDERRTYIQLRQKSITSKYARRASRQNRFKLYDKKRNDEAGYSKEGYLDDVLYVPAKKLKEHMGFMMKQS